jgi:mRNA-degrading endonuclease YafQ of YafQ-DinJ toxin-antitoxin module
LILKRFRIGSQEKFYANIKKDYVEIYKVLNVELNLKFSNVGIHLIKHISVGGAV